VKRGSYVTRLADPHYLAAVFYWATSRVLRLQVHNVLTIALSRAAARIPELPPDYRFHAIRDTDQLAALGGAIEAQLNDQSGLSCRSMLARGDRIYAIVDSRGVACQLNMRRAPLTVDSPSELVFEFDADCRFLNYLYTRDDQRGRGLAGRLIRLAAADCADEGSTRCFSHVRATNHASLRAFRRCGWKRSARILSTRSGRFLAAPGCLAAGLAVRRVNSAESSA
jgi:GNAT superfamily N-acetyltransferase